jgi:hypothetical protein
VMIVVIFIYKTKNTLCEKEIQSLKQEMKTEIQLLKQEVEIEKQRNKKFIQIGEILYNHVVNNQPIAKWTTADMVNFVEYYRTLKTDFIDDLDKNYPKLTPRYKIILVLEDMGKKMEEIMQIMSFGENAYYSAKSRINGAKK